MTRLRHWLLPHAGEYAYGDSKKLHDRIAYIIVVHFT
jgi:hypothetical protein